MTQPEAIILSEVNMKICLRATEHGDHFFVEVKATDITGVEKKGIIDIGELVPEPWNAGVRG